MKINQAYVINLDRRPDRMKTFNERIKNLGLDFEFKRFSAIDGAVIKKPLWYWPPQGAWGCFLSHLSIIINAASSKANNVMVVEDDSVFRDNFKDDFYQCLSELPENWDMLYIGGENINTNKVPPIKISQHLAKSNAVNLTTGYVINGKSFDKIISKLFDFERFRYCNNHSLKCIQHIDRQFVEMASTGLLNVYVCYPWLSGQDAGTSDVGCYAKRSNIVFYDFEPSDNAIPVGDGISILHYRCGYGTLGIDGKLGYEDQIANPPFPGETISLHAPSLGIFELTKKKYFYIYLDGADDAESEIKIRCNDRCFGIIQKAGESTEPILLLPGHYNIELTVKGNNNFAHTVFCFRDDPWVPIPEDSWVEILCNSSCPRNCFACNQSAFMKANPDYFWTTENANNLVKALENNGARINVLFSGGEPMLWKEMDESVAILRKSKNIGRIGVTTSQDNKEHIEHCSSIFDVIYFSHRRSMQWNDKNIPDYLKKANIWFGGNHVAWPTSEWMDSVQCCCTSVGVRCAIIGNKVYPCVIAETLRLMGKWSSLKPINMDDYFSGRTTFGKIGSYDACHLCVNNRYYRNISKSVQT